MGGRRNGQFASLSNLFVDSDEESDADSRLVKRYEKPTRTSMSKTDKPSSFFFFFFLKSRLFITVFSLFFFFF